MRKHGLCMACIFVFGNVLADVPKLPVPLISLNTAPIEKLFHAVKGIGHKKAEAIVAYRTMHGPFHAVEDLSRVLGVHFVQQHLPELKSIFTVG
ncbi:MAG: helix-hairpin-helix domain-containing protein [Legionellaceae bacterium]|nr:helix-hairpin-helix domain-containing protein [Legionellaceae bacterium]